MIDKDKVIQLAKDAGWTDIQLSMAAPAEIERLSRFYTIAFKAGMEMAAEICDRLAGVTAKWPEASEGLTAETKFVRGVGDCMATFGEEIRAEAHAQNQPKPIHDSSVV